MDPVSVAAVRSLMADAFGAAIVTNGVDVFTVAHLGRSVTEYQRSALEARGHCCEVPRCGATRGLEIDHVVDWDGSFRTTLDALAWMCRPDHLRKTYDGWRLEGPPGNLRWIRPDASAPGRRASPAGSPDEDDGLGQDAPDLRDGTGEADPATEAGLAAPHDGTGEAPTLFGDAPAA